MINLYTTGCPKCKILEMKLKQKNIVFNEISNLEILKSKNILNVPVLEVDNTFYDFVSACKMVNEFEENKKLENFIDNKILNEKKVEDYGYRF